MRNHFNSLRRGLRALRLAHGAALGAAGATSLSGTVAHANDPFFDVGAYVGHTFGEGGGFTFGVSTRAGLDVCDRDNCSGTPTGQAAAAVFRAELVSSRLRMVLGGQVGGYWGPAQVMAELGIGYRFGEGGGLSIPLGLDLQVWAFDAFVSHDFRLQNQTLGLGLRLPAVDHTAGLGVEGRPLHTETGRATLPEIRKLGDGRASGELEQVLVEEWNRRAAGEWASVPAFLQLAEQLARAGAPRSLVARALTAAREELRHAIVSARVAVLITGSPSSLARVSPAVRAPASGIEALQRLAVESYVDGCLGEGRAALAAHTEAQQTELDHLRNIGQMIAVDEARHRDLAWDVLAWSLATGGDDVRDALHAVRDAAIPYARQDDHGVVLPAASLLAEETHETLAAEVSRVARARLDTMLAA